MQKTVLSDVFELWQQIGAVNSESELSKYWLCRSECCVRSLRGLYVQANYSTTDVVWRLMNSIHSLVNALLS
jgi:hypothetical protein